VAQPVVAHSPAVVQVVQLAAQATQAEEETIYPEARALQTVAEEQVVQLDEQALQALAVVLK
jgi:hypothetical protein